MVLYEWVRNVYGVMLGGACANRLVTVGLILAIFCSSLLLIPFIAASSCPPG